MLYRRLICPLIRFFPQIISQILHRNEIPRKICAFKICEKINCSQNSENDFGVQHGDSHFTFNIFIIPHIIKSYE
jgi:hypothetical protein